MRVAAVRIAPKNALASDAITQTARAGKASRGDLSGIHVEPAANGYVVTSHFEPRTSGKGPALNPDPERNVFGDHKKAVTHIAALLAAHAGAAGNQGTS